MNTEVVPWFAFALSLLGVLAGFVWNAASTKTAHHMRLEALEVDRKDTRASIDKLAAAVTKLDKHLAVNEARASQGQFNEGDSDRPNRG